jgi:hypothetical protein
VSTVHPARVMRRLPQRQAHGASLSMILFESEEAAQAAVEWARANPAPTVTPISIEIGEVREHV